MVINFCSSIEDLSVPQINNSVGRKLSAMNMVTCFVKGSSKNKPLIGIQMYWRKHCQNESRQRYIYANT